LGFERSHELAEFFYLFQHEDLKSIFASLGFRLLDFSRNASKTGTGEIWLRYLLQKE
jgi:hypothetical protein